MGLEPARSRGRGWWVRSGDQEDPFFRSTALGDPAEERSELLVDERPPRPSGIAVPHQGHELGDIGELPGSGVSCARRVSRESCPERSSRSAGAGGAEAEDHGPAGWVEEHSRDVDRPSEPTAPLRKLDDPRGVRSDAEPQPHSSDGRVADPYLAG